EQALTLPKLADAPLGKLGKWIRPSGYFRQKARKLQLFARHVRGLGSRIPAVREELLALWGIGPETADSILLYAHGRPVFVIDAYPSRISRRIGWLGEKAGYDEAQRFFESKLTNSAKLYAEFHALLVELAKRHCKTKPVCEGCPVRRSCQYAQHES